ncbi:MAG: stage II sporulation protein P [Clostridia bacterium]|nr:stage II sporulation protein P [Clostridia bacterium]
MRNAGKTHILRRVAALTVTAALTGLVLTAPIDWSQLAQDAAGLALGLRQPQHTAAMLEQHLFDTPDPPAMAPLLSDQRADTGLLAEPEAALPAYTAVTPPQNDKSGGKVVTRKMSGNRAKYGIATVNRSGKREDIPAALKADLPFTFEDTDEPQVLILHTHTTEGYMTYDAGYFLAGDRDRTRDHKKNVCAVGEAIRLTLEAAGIGVIHDTTVHDSPQYTGAYGRSAVTAEAILKKHPSIKLVLDVHRDAVLENGAVVKPTATVRGKKAAQMMLITGTVTTAELPHRHWQKNLALSTQLQAALDKVSPDLMRPLNTVASRYNQHLSPGWVLVEVGAEGNTVEEAVYSGQLLAETLLSLLD